MAYFGVDLTTRVARFALGLASLATALAIVPVALVGAQDGSEATEAPAPPPAATLAVSIVDFNFEPAALSVRVGDTVVWTNNGRAPHTATSDANDWNAGRFDPGQTGSVVFNTAGAFAYHCGIHASMRGTITVTE